MSTPAEIAAARAPRPAATFAGCGAILLWSLLALFTAASGTVPPFQLAAMTFLVGGLCGCAAWIAAPARARVLRQTWHVWLLGVGGLFGYHALYFSALRLAPPAEAGLINYLWPLLIVLFSARLPGSGGLQAGHLAGAVLGLAGVAALFAGGETSTSPRAHCRATRLPWQRPLCGPDTRSSRPGSGRCRPMPSRGSASSPRC